jgi:hypothetical protein
MVPDQVVGHHFFYCSCRCEAELSSYLMNVVKKIEVEGIECKIIYYLCDSIGFLKGSAPEWN